jgi:hypothetical protein
MSADQPDDFSHVTSTTPSNPAASTGSTSAAGHNNPNEKFMNQKDRRKSSQVKMFLGDYLSLATNQTILKVMAKHGMCF